MDTLTLILYVAFAPLLGGLLAGVDRRITARMQGRFGPPILQPFYDVVKLFNKENLVVRRSQTVYIIFFLAFMVFTGGIFYAGEDLLLVIFSLMLANTFLVLAAYKGSSPYSAIGAERELLQIMAYEPMVLFYVVGIYMASKTFYIETIATTQHPMLIRFLPGIFLGFLYVLTIKLRKSPFDLSTSHHGHQEIVKGITTEFTGPSLGLIEITHWYENVLLLGMVSLFFAPNLWLGAGVALAIYLLEIFIDNACARARWQFTVFSSWVVAAVLGFGNILALTLFG
ncbi:MAG TPA: NADH-quinone oxidoreductase subunit H [Syntrophales bacterium]|jgi:formate hydrogenlyase subunit 4|nr:NADH-quinone oxidoreductase subunit H [Syntrophales bacterium]